MDKLLFAIACIIIALAGIFGLNTLMYVLMTHPISTALASLAILYVYFKLMNNEN